MNQTESALHYLGVICLHCKRPVPVQLQPADQPLPERSADSALTDSSANRVFLAWCQVCNREAPYATSEIVKFSGPAPLSHFRPRPTQAMQKTSGAY